ncbi:MAG: hypothetical protein PUB67_07015 [Clostridiales bacterium]|nr:hypothetical protein [Clostridiales bacterium]
MKFFGVDKKSLILVIISVIIMGFCVSFLNRCNFGTDPCTATNLSIANIIGASLGNTQAVINIILLIIVVAVDRSHIGWGTFANMFLVGYSFDFMNYITRDIIKPEWFENMAVRIGVVIPVLALFIFAASIYMAAMLGASPYDAISFIIASKQSRLSFKTVRIIYDGVFVVLGYVLGRQSGVVTLIMAFLLGPMISWCRVNIIEKYVLKGKDISEGVLLHG